MKKEKHDLSLLVINNDITGIKKLINEKGIDVTDKYGRTLLMESVISRNSILVKFLLDNGANPNIQEMNNWTALHFACQEYDLEIVKLLLENKADLSIKDSYGNTPLFRAVYNSRGRGEIIKLLLHNGADRNIKNNTDVSPYELACRIGNFDIKQFFD